MNRVASRANWLSGIFTPEISLTIMLDLPSVAGKVPNSLPFRSGRGDRHCCHAKLEIAQLMPIGRERFLFRFPKTQTPSTFSMGRRTRRVERLLVHAIRRA